MGEPRLVERADPEDVFTALSNDTRVAILRALWDADDHEAVFSELREAVGMPDSGQFNYHLEQLVGLFVSDTDDGYGLTQAGMRINGAIDAGFCSFCDGRVEPTVGPATAFVDVPEEHGGAGQRPRELPLIRYDCQRCGATPTNALSLALLEHPAVAGFHYDRGIDVTERSIWEFTAFDTDRERIRSRDPLRASATYRAGGDSLTLVVDEQLDVLEVDA